MNSIHPAEPRWRRRQWCLGLVFLVVLQIALLDRYELPDNPAFTAISSPSFVEPRMIQFDIENNPNRTVDPGTAPSINPAGPALFSLAHPRGFSGAIWEFMPKVEPPMIEWKENPLWLPLDERRLGNTFPNTLQNDPAPDSRFKTPRSPAGFEQLPFRAPLIRTNSQLRIAGPLAQRRLLSTTAFPTLEHTNILARTVVQTAVDEDGFPVVLRATERSGWPVADTTALNLAQEARFERIEKNDNADRHELLWGDLIFHWHIRPPGPTTKAP